MLEILLYNSEIEINTTQKISRRYIQIWRESLGAGAMAQLVKGWIPEPNPKHQIWRNKSRRIPGALPTGHSN